MQRTVPEFLALLKSLDAEGVRFVVIGGIAMVLQGATCVTFDLDLAVSVEPANVSAAVRALAPFKPFPPQAGSPSNFVWDERSFKLAVLNLMTTAGSLDILTVLPGVESFEGLWARAELRTIGGVAVKVASLGDLIAMKTAANRPKDVDHLRQLEALRALREP